MKLLEPCVTFARNIAPRALVTRNVVPEPDWTSRFALLRKETASAFLLQALLPTRVALPCGLIRKLKVEGDR